MNFPEKYEDADFVVKFKYDNKKDTGYFNVYVNEKLEENEKTIKILNDLKLFFEKERTLIEIEKILNFMKTHQTSFIREFATVLIKSIDSVWADDFINHYLD